jgi:DMSO/TMAO reductase YedYZ molybdopterin-dependent catalytic subunit
MDTEILQRELTEAPEEREQVRARPRLRKALSILRTGAIALVAGLPGSLAAILIMGALRLTVGTPTLPELLGDRILPLLSAKEFVALLVRFAPDSKTTPLALTLLGQFVLGVLLGPLYHIAAGGASGSKGFWPGRRAWLAAGVFVLAMEALGLVIFWPVMAQNLMGDPVDRARLLTALSMLATFAGAVGVLLFADHWLQRSWGTRPAASIWKLSQPGIANRRRLASPAAPQSVSSGADSAAIETVPGVSRRTALQAAGVVVVAIAAGGIGFNRLLAGYLARSNLGYEGQETSSLAPITPTEDFYIVSKNVLDPEVVVGRWELEVTGLVSQPKTWNYDQVRALPSEKRIVTFECIANGVGSHLISTAEWKGALLKTLLDEAGGVDPTGKYIIFSSVDGYQYSLPLAALLEARALLAWEMNGAPLENRHGFPLRAVVPGRYGEQSPKWLTRIEVVDHPYTGGLYQSQGWASTQVATTSRINHPSGSVPLGPVQVTGFAFAGIRGIQKVELSTDSGVTWQTATLMPPLSDQSWVFWTWLWTPPARGTYQLVVRATDGTGTLQTGARRGTVPSGATGWQHVTIHIV